MMLTEKLKGNTEGCKWAVQYLFKKGLITFEGKDKTEYNDIKEIIQNHEVPNFEKNMDNAYRKFKYDKIRKNKKEKKPRSYNFDDLTLERLNKLVKTNKPKKRKRLEPTKLLTVLINEEFVRQTRQNEKKPGKRPPTKRRDKEKNKLKKTIQKLQAMILESMKDYGKYKVLCEFVSPDENDLKELQSEIDIENKQIEKKVNEIVDQESKDDKSKDKAVFQDMSPNEPDLQTLTK